MKKNKDIKTLFSNTILLYMMKISGYIFPLITFPYLTRKLGASNFGVMTYADSVMEYFKLLVDFGFLLYATRECSIYKHDKNKLGSILASVVQSKVIIALGGLAVLIGLIFTVDEFRTKALYLLLSYISVLLNVFVPDYLFRGMEQMGNIAYRTIAAKFIYTVLVISLVRTSEQFVLIPIFMAASDLFVVWWSWRYILKKLSIRPTKVSLIDTFRTIKDSSIFFLSRAASTVYTNSNIVVLGHFVSNATVGQFSSVNRVVTSARGMFAPIMDSIYPYMVAKRDFKLIKKIIIYTFPIILAGTAFLYLKADWIVSIFCGKGNGFEGAVPIFRAMLPMMLITLPIYLLGYPTLGAMNMLKEANLTVVYAAIYHAIGLIILCATGNLNGVAVSLLTCTSETVVLISRSIYVYLGWKEGRCIKVEEV